MNRTRVSLSAGVVALAVLASLTLGPRAARADGGCKPDGQRCATNMSCCSRDCMKPAPPPGHAVALFGICCTPTTCAAQGKNCGTIADGDCTGFTLSCGGCTAPQTCGGGGTPNVCGCTPTTCAAQGKNCGTISNGCGGTLNCGTCSSGECCSAGSCSPLNAPTVCLASDGSGSCAAGGSANCFCCGFGGTCVSSCDCGECCSGGLCVFTDPSGPCLASDGTCAFAGDSNCFCCELTATCVSSCGSGECCSGGECQPSCPSPLTCVSGACQ